MLGENIYTEEQRPEAIEAQSKDNLLRDPLLADYYEPVGTVTAYIRRGENSCNPS